MWQHIGQRGLRYYGNLKAALPRTNYAGGELRLNRYHSLLLVTLNLQHAMNFVGFKDIKQSRSVPLYPVYVALGVGVAVPDTVTV